ncbi:MAG: hypothetical protein KJ560_22170 [Gammaproteobacteria bacterium]|nr:hypothetical protein [Gammaproteobacteria bacterium]
MKISLATTEGQEILQASRAKLSHMPGAVLSFHVLCEILGTESAEQGAAIAEFLCSKEVNILRHVYFFLDEDDMPVQLSRDAVYHYVRCGEFFHPRSHKVLEEQIVEESIIIEFEVLE